ncbi:dephospho-CoA kinase [Alteromonas sp. H39]|uniref:dephospho-CoA kinase n=1 Tax=Alteromonas sp. H39 TaxID=3389876 RepID=UPI0039DF5E00
MPTKLVVGLTGGIGSGKSAVTTLFASHGIDIIDADVVARDVVKPGSVGLKEIVSKFGDTILLDDGTLNRAQLREVVFHDADNKTWLNALLHPLIREAMQSGIQNSTSEYCILAVPLLIENKLTTMVNRVLVVDCTEQQQLERAMLRDGSSEQTIRNIMASQASREERLQAADDVIDNTGSKDTLVDQVNACHMRYLRLAEQQ